MRVSIVIIISFCFTLELDAQVTKVFRSTWDANGKNRVDTIITSRPDTIFNKPNEQLLNQAKAQSNSFETPIFKSKRDSTAYATIQIKIDDALQNPVYNKKLIDSLFLARLRIAERGIIGFRRNYSANPKYTHYENVKSIDPNEVKSLSIANVSSLPDLRAFDNLEVLELVNTSVTKIPRRLNRLTKLKTVYIYNNKSKAPLKLRRNSNITTLVIEGDRPSSLPKSFKPFVSLTKLDLSRNSLQLFPNGGRNNKKLVELILTNNAITLANNEIKPHPYLKKLDLYKNKIVKVPGSIGDFPSLEILKFNYNLIDEVSPDISKLGNLKHLSFYSNRLSAIPDGVYGIASLEEIDLYYNDIERLDERVTQWKNLEVLYLAYNKIFLLPENLGELTKLEELYLHDNRLNSLPTNLGALSNLKVLRINDNNLLYVPPLLPQLINLENLDISKNQIQSLPEDFFNFKHLKILALVSNPWDAETKAMLSEKAKELRAKDVVVHLNSYDETLED